MRKKNIDQLPPVTDELRKRARELRDEYLESLGFDVLRFSNTDVVDNIGGVLEVIRGRLR